MEVSEEVHCIIGPPPPVKPGIVLENGMTARMRGAPSARGEPSGVGRLEMDAVIWAQNLR